MSEYKFPDQEQIKKEVESGTFTTFRSLLRRGIGTRTQGAFAEQVGVSRSTVSKMLNLKTIPRPEKKTLEAFASQMFSVSYLDLCQACGYEPDDINEIAAQIKKAIIEGVNALKGGLATKSPREFLDQIETLFMPPVKTRWQAWPMDEEEIPAVVGEQRKLYSCEWDYGDNHGSTFFAIGYSDTANRHIVLNGVRVDEQCVLSTFLDHVDGKKIKFNADLACIIKKRQPADGLSMEEKLLRSIFGETETFIQTEIGWGFYYKETPAGFNEYLAEHASSFCTNKENRKLFAQWAADQNNSDKVFASYKGEGYDAGTGAVVAHIISVETGKPFIYTEKETEEGPEDACVYYTEGVSQTNRRMPIDEKILGNLYSAALELGIQKFGQVYHRVEDSCLEDQLYDISRFHYEFVQKEKPEEKK